MTNIPDNGSAIIGKISPFVAVDRRNDLTIQLGPLCCPHDFAGRWKRDRVEKQAFYEQVGIAEYWIADLESRSMKVFALVKGVCPLHSRAAEAVGAESKLLTAFKVPFLQLLH